MEMDTRANSYRYIGLKQGLYLVDRIQAEQTAEGYLFSRLRDDSPSVADKTIIEIAKDGFELWSYRLTGATHAIPLPGGNTSVCVTGRLVEITPDKRMVGDVPCEHWLMLPVPLPDSSDWALKRGQKTSTSPCLRARGYVA